VERFAYQVKTMSAAIARLGLLIRAAADGRKQERYDDAVSTDLLDTPVDRRRTLNHRLGAALLAVWPRVLERRDSWHPSVKRAGF
jgi:hypothetical protein